MTAEIRRTFLADVKWLGFVQIALHGRSLVILPFLTRELGIVDYGIWAQVGIITVVASSLIDWGAADGFIRRKAGAPIEERARLFRAWVYAIAIAFVVVFFVAMAAAEPLARHVLGAPERGLQLVAFAILLALSSALLNAEIAWLKLNGESHIHSLALLTDAVLGLAAVAAFLLIGGSVVFLAALIFLADAVVVGGLFARHLLRHGWGGPDFKEFWSTVRYGLPLMPTSFANIGINWVDRFVLLRYLSMADVGIYSLAHGIAQMTVQTFTQPVRAYYPSRATAAYNAGNSDEIRTLYGLSAGTLFAVHVPAVIGLYFVAPTFLAIMAPPEFAAGASVLPLLFAGYAIERQSTYGLLVFEWQFRQHWVTIILCGGLALNLLLNFCLVPWLGLLGAAVANVSSFAIRYLVVLMMVGRASPLRINLGFVAKILAAGAIMGFGLSFLPNGPDSGDFWRLTMHLAVQLAAGATVYMVALCAWGVIAPSSIKNAFSLVRGF